ncbi:MAG TPA: transketolase C-terminal domain-containing protein, partial [Candidatus Thermoplasmatota archaeon]|nr:transketolase C-terminal domain-containing protein [Candidatus Thermoplasmatota archaeon]
VGGDGATHQMLEDMSLMRGLPNMRVFVPADGPQTQDIIRLIADSEGPCYVRLPRGDTPLLPDVYPTELGKAITIREGSDVTLIGAGTMVYETLRAADQLVADGLDPRVLLIHTIKPIDTQAILAAARETNGIVTAEEHSVYGGLGSAVCEVVAENQPCPVRRIGVRDTFGESGDERDLMEKYGLTWHHIADAARDVMKG